MAYENNDGKIDSVYTKKIKAGKRRTYFFDVRETKGNDYYLTITESRKRTTGEGYDRHKIFLYKEDFNKFQKGLDEAIGYVKTDLMPDFDFDAFNHEYADGYDQAALTSAPPPSTNEPSTTDEPVKEDLNDTGFNSKHSTEESDKW